MTKEHSPALSEQEMAELIWAYRHLEHPSLAARLSSVLALPIEEGLALLPKSWRRRLDQVAQASVHQILRLATGTMPLARSRAPSTLTHKLVISGVGAAGGFFGPISLLAELPVTTTLILRAIADVAQAEGEDLNDRDTRIACVQVFALGGRTKEDDDADLGYYGLKFALGLYFERDILDIATGKGTHIPAVINLVRAISARFGVVISDKTAAQMVPIAGALSGALLNLIFMNHYQDVAKGHFIIRRLERSHGVEAIRRAYQKLIEEEQSAERDYSPIEGW